MKKFIILLFFCLMIIPNLSFAKILEIGSCYMIKKGYGENKFQNKSWNFEDFNKSNTLYAKVYDEPVRSDYDNWEIWEGEVSYDDEEIKDLKKDGYLAIKRYDKMILSINLSNNTITELRVKTNDLLDFYYDIYLRLIKLKKKFPNKWSTSGKFPDEENLKFWQEASSEELDKKKFKIEDYVGGIFTGRQFDSLQYSDGWAIKVDLDKLTYKQWFYDKINNRNLGDVYICTDAKNINTNKNRNKKSNSGLKELLKKIY